jgi:hypothetical protein
MFVPIAQAGVISDAPPLVSYFYNVLDFVLSVVGVLGIIGLVVSGVLYLVSGGDANRVRLSKRTAVASVVGLLIAIGSLIAVRQLTSFYQ